MADIERTYNIPLRKETQKVPLYNRSKKAISGIKKFISRHMKSDDIKIDNHLNKKVWKNGIKNPPHHVKVIAKKNNEGRVTVTIPNPPKKSDKKKIKENLIKKTEEITADEQSEIKEK